MSSHTEVAIIGAGPYGLSIAAHLRAQGTPFRIFGPPMRSWRERMPKGMHLKSDGFASNLYEPEHRFTLRKYCADHGLPYADLGHPVPLETFTAYGAAFQKHHVPSLDAQLVTKLEHNAAGFTLTLEDGQHLSAKRVIIATGITHYEYIPDALANLPRAFCSHSADNHDLSRYKNREVLVVGRGASATDIAALLRDHGATVQIVSRAPVIFHLPPSKKPRSVWARIRNPNLGLGPNLRSAICTLFPAVFHSLPARLRQRIVRRHLGPAAVWFIKDKLVGHVPMHAGFDLQNAGIRGDRVYVRFVDRNGIVLELQADHVIAATGYRVDLLKLPFLSDEIRRAVRLNGSSPSLSRRFESSLPGLFFVGMASAVAFGPLTRFALGARYTSQIVGRYLRGRLPRSTANTVTSAQS